MIALAICIAINIIFCGLCWFGVVGSAVYCRNFVIRNSLKFKKPKRNPALSLCLFAVFSVIPLCNILLAIFLLDKESVLEIFIDRGYFE